MSDVKLLARRIEKQRALLENEIKNNGNLLDPKILNESQKLDLILNKYMKSKDSGCTHIL